MLDTNEIKKVRLLKEDLIDAFVWEKSRLGHKFWSFVADELVRMLEDEK